MATPNTSATGGVLSPIAPIIPVDDDALDAVFQVLVTSITGLPGNYVRPRWQPVPQKQPEPNVNWCAIGVVDADDTDCPWIVYDPANNQEDYLDDETVDVMASFYGPSAQQFRRFMCAGINIPQNTEQLLAYAIRFTGRGPMRMMSELVNQQWRRRYDVMFSFRRRISLSYGVENLLSSTINLIDDTVVNDLISVTPGTSTAGLLLATDSWQLIETDTGQPIITD